MAQIALRRSVTTLPEATLIGLAIVVTLMLSAGILLGGSVFFVAFAGAALALGAMIQPRVGLYAATVMLVLLSPLATNPAFGQHLAQINEPVPGLWFMPIELMIVFASLGVLRMKVFERDYTIRAGDLWAPIFLFLFTIAGALALGLAQGGDVNIAMWETRGIFFIAPAYYVTTNALTERRHLETFSRIFVAAAFVMSAEALYRHMTYIRPGYTLDLPLDLAFSHEASLFAGLLAIYFLTRMLWSSSLTGSVGYGLLMLVPIAALMVMRRRAGIIALDVSLIMIAIAMFRHDLLRFTVIIPFAMVASAALLAFTWNDPGATGQPARAVRSITDSNGASSDDQASDDYRTRETANVRANILARPVAGLGFGRPYDMPNELPNLGSFWPFFRYIPHNSMLWIWIKAGIAGFGAMLALFGVAAMRSGQLFRHFTGDPLQAAALVAGAGVVMFAVFAYVDLGLASPTATAFFALTLGMLGALSEIAKRERDDATTEAAA